MPRGIITLIGPDGAGKTTLARKLCAAFGRRGKYIYVGSNPDGTTHALPTTRAWLALKRALGRDTHRPGPPAIVRQQPPAMSVGRRLIRHVKSLFPMLLRVSEDAYRLSLAELFARTGHVVILDRHPYADYHAHRIAPRGQRLRWGDRIHGVLLDRAYPRPDPAILLDAPADVLLARKNEGTREEIEARREEYHRLARDLPNLVVLDVTRPEEEVWATLWNETQRLLAPDLAPRTCGAHPPPPEPLS